jgi:translation initiation factor eIF-2B subunit epsilon
MMLVHPPSSRLLHYSLYPLAPSQSRFDIPSTLFSDPYPADIDTYEIWGPTSSESSVPGYRDIGVDICGPEVLLQCTENFDYHDLRRHLLTGVLTSELLGKRIAVHLFGDEEGAGKYVERIRDTRTYGEVSGDVLRRWAFPLVPDLNETGGLQYELRRGNVYVAKDEVKLARYVGEVIARSGQS